MSKSAANKGKRRGQLSLGFPDKLPRLDSLFVTEANEAAVSVLRQPESWPFPVLCVIGPEKCGLTTLATAWCVEFEGTFFSADEISRLKPADVSRLSAIPVAIDDADAVKRSENLLSLINTAASGSSHLLLTAKHHPGSWQTNSADLKSRLNALPVIEISEPDEMLFKARLNAAATRHFLRLDPDVVKYLVPRLDRTYQAIERFIDRLSEGVTLTGRAPSVPLAREVLEELGWNDPDDGIPG